MNKFTDLIRTWGPIVGTIVGVIVLMNIMNYKVIALEKSDKEKKVEIRENSDSIIIMKEMQKHIYEKMDTMQKNTYNKIDDMQQQIKVLGHEQLVQYKELISAINGIKK